MKEKVIRVLAAEVTDRRQDIEEMWN